MDIWEIDKSLLFLVLVLPGFISIKVYSLLIAVEARDYSKSLVEAVCYSSLNFSVFSWLIVLISSEGFYHHHPFIYWIGLFLVFFGAPSIWPFLFRWISELKVFKKNILSPYKQPWDYVFAKKESMWIVVYLKDGEIIRGKFAEKSFASSYPSERQIYIEEVWREKNGKKFGEKVTRTKGILISQDEIKYIKFLGK
ncbi:DUF6338 family protein [Marinobacter salexigens]|uniref:DUF6338 family protein n=1 Tax=Marinobacter salexigens TaxID=1925763 RepID=UPI000C2932C9|nr:DUF6338 family protein [Marinobacter salexigens]